MKRVLQLLLLSCLLRWSSVCCGSNNVSSRSVEKAHTRTGVSLVIGPGLERRRHRHPHYHTTFFSQQALDHGGSREDNITETEMLPEAEVLRLLPQEMKEEEDYLGTQLLRKRRLETCFCASSLLIFTCGCKVASS